MANWRAKELFEVFDAIFYNKTSVTIRGKEYQRSIVGANKLRAFYIEGYCIIEQNPTKTSSYAKRARKGAHIAWIIPPQDKNWWRMEFEENSTVWKSSTLLYNSKGINIAQSFEAIIDGKTVTTYKLTNNNEAEGAK